MPIRLTAALGSAAALLLTVVPVSAAQADESGNATATAAAAQYIADSYSAGAAPDSVIALAAADTQPETLARMTAALPAGAGSATNAASRGKYMIAADAGNLDARFFADATCSTNWATVLRDEADGNQLGAYWAPQFAVIALARLGEPAPEPALSRIISAQGPNGAWGYGSGAGFTAQPDDTAMSIYALGLVADSPVEAAETRAAAEAALAKAIEWSESEAARRQLDGNYYWATYSAANSTGLMASALAEVGEDVSSPQAFLVAQQALTGSGWSNQLSGTSPQLMATTQAILGVAGAGYGKANASGDVLTTCAQPPAFTGQPQDVAAPPSTAKLSATVVADSLQWQRFEEGAWADVEGATAAELVTTTEGQYRLTATNAQGSSFSHVATLTLTDEPTPTPTPSATPSATPTPTGTPSATPSVTPSSTPTGTPSATPSADPAPVDVYTTPGVHRVGGRVWTTTCEPYSQTTRCRTDIWATTVALREGRYVRTTDWAFNNLTYVASPRALWAGNPLAAKGEWTATDGRAWRTDCDSAATGRGGCRNYLEATVVSAAPSTDGGWAFTQADQWVFNGMVRFS